MKFRATLGLHGKTATGFEVPPKVVEQLGSTKRPPVQVTINGYTYRNTVAVMGGKYMVGVSAEHRKAARISAGDKLEIELVLDREPREVAVPADLARALKGDPDAKRRFDALSYSHRKEWVRSIEDAKTPETRQRRIDKAMSAMSAMRDNG
jgi:hypothetical protein